MAYKYANRLKQKWDFTILRPWAYPLGVDTTLSQMSKRSPQSSSVLFSLVAFSGKILQKDAVKPFWQNIFDRNHLEIDCDMWKPVDMVMKTIT